METLRIMSKIGKKTHLMVIRDIEGQRYKCGWGLEFVDKNSRDHIIKSVFLLLEIGDNNLFTLDIPISSSTCSNWKLQAISALSVYYINHFWNLTRFISSTINIEHYNRSGCHKLHSACISTTSGPIFTN